ncbi:MAG: hypothetical protein ACRD0H_10765 [Actinomycetes bacterium]
MQCIGGQFSDGFIIGIGIASATTTLGLTPLWVGLLGAATLTGLFLGAAALSAAQFFVDDPTQLLVLRFLLGLALATGLSRSRIAEVFAVLAGYGRSSHAGGSVERAAVHNRGPLSSGSPN